MPTSLHQSLKELYAGKSANTEVEVDGYRVDATRRGTLVEIQTGSFAAIRKKLRALVERHKVLLVYPIPQTKHIIRLDPASGEVLGRRKSTKRGSYLDAFDEMVYMPSLIAHPNFSLEIVLTEEEELRCADGRGSWRRRRISIVDRRLVWVAESRRVSKPSDLLRLLPDDLPRQFTTADIASALSVRRWVATRIAYCLRHGDATKLVGRRGRFLLYEAVSRRRKRP